MLQHIIEKWKNEKLQFTVSMLVLYVDGMLITRNDPEKIEITSLGEPQKFLVIQNIEAGTMILHQTEFFKSIVQ